MMVPCGTIMNVMTCRVIGQRVKARRAIVMIARRPMQPGVIPGQGGRVRVT
jgi:hypothetical protein